MTQSFPSPRAGVLVGMVAVLLLLIGTIGWGVLARIDGAVVVPLALLDEVLAEAPEQERMEAWIVSEVERGEKLPGLYPMNAETRARYDSWKS